MSQISVSGESVAALGEALARLGVDLANLPRGGADGLPTGATSATLTDLLGNWDLARRRLASDLVDLGTAARVAGTAYLAVDDAVGAGFGGR